MNKIKLIKIKKMKKWLFSVLLNCGFIIMKRLMNIQKIILIFCIFAISACVQRNINMKQISFYSDHVSISPNDQHIIFSVYNKNESSIYISDINGKNARSLAYSSNQYQVHPEYSPDGQKILYIALPNKADYPYSYLYVMNSDGSNVRQITFNKQHIVEAIFSSDSKKIYFLASGEFKHYSPLVGPRPHGFDLYSIDIDGNNLNRVTNFNAYEMESLSINAQGNKLLVRVQSYPDNMLYLINLENINKGYPLEKNDIETICRDTYQPILSRDGKSIFFIAASNPNSGQKFEYEIFSMGLETKTAKQLTKMKGIDQHSFQIFHNQEKIIFINGYGDNCPNLMEMNTDGFNLHNLPLFFSK